MNIISWAFLALAFALCASILPPSRGRSAVFLAGSWAAVLLVLIGSVHSVVLGSTQRVVPGVLVILPGFGFALDPLRGLFLIIAAGVYAVSAPFVLRDVRDRSRPRARLLLAMTVVLFAAMLTVLLAAGVASLLFAWEIMSLALATLVFLGRGEAVETRAGLLTLAFSEAGALSALAGLLVLAGAAGTFSLAGIAAAVPRLSGGVAWAGFLLTLFGFGVKTAIMPVNGWMTDAYAAAPRGVLPLFSGATLNLGVFTLWVVDGPLASHALWPALAVLVVGALTALLGIMYALTESNMTRLLTRSSIENLGIIVAALGAGFAFTAMHRPMLGGLALIAGLYHMLNHSAYKTLLFIGAGGIGTTVGHDDMNRLGGLLKNLPLFGTVFLLGCFAIASLPPFNGFVSEWLILQSLLRIVELGPVPVRIVFGLAGAALALTAGLAVTCFAMLATSTLLGLPRSREAADARRMPASATAPMTVLIVICFGLGVGATGVIPVLGRITAPLTGVDATADLVPAFFGHPSALAAGVVHDLTPLGAQLGRGLLPLRGLVVLHSDAPRAGVVYAMSTALTFAVLACMLLVVWVLARVLRRRRQVARRAPWNAGIPRLRPEMVYTPTTFASPVRVLFDAVLDPEVSRQEQRQGAFLTAREHQVVHVHLFDRLLLAPLVGGMQGTARLLARMHHGKVTVYAGYVLASLVVVILAAAITLS
ncbi:MAG: proton-conducting transporter membrane subunit [Steroidobacteraceae bacterium]